MPAVLVKKASDPSNWLLTPRSAIFTYGEVLGVYMKVCVWYWIGCRQKWIHVTSKGKLNWVDFIPKYLVSMGSVQLHLIYFFLENRNLNFFWNLSKKKNEQKYLASVGHQEVAWFYVPVNDLVVVHWNTESVLVDEKS